MCDEHKYVSTKLNMMIPKHFFGSYPTEIIFSYVKLVSL